jgi:hypothetical protein
MTPQRFDDLDDATVLQLTADQISRWIDITCAIEGVPLLPAEPVMPESVDFTPDTTAYEVEGLIFANAEDAAKMVALLRGMTVYGAQYCNCPGYKRVLTVKTGFVVDMKEFFSPARWDTIKAAGADASRQENLYNAAMIEYNKIIEARRHIVDSISERVEAVHQREGQRDRIRTEFARYLDLANGDQAIALRFLLNAWKFDEALVIEVFPEAASR